MSFFTTAAEHSESLLRRALPYSLMAFLLIIHAISPLVAIARDIKAPFFLMGLYYWAIYRPTLIPPAIAFLGGFFIDLLGGLPLGLNAVAFVLAQWIISDQRRFLMGQSFVVIWFGFFLLNLFTSLMQWLIFGLLFMSLPPLQPLGFSFTVGLALFPLVCVTLHWTHKLLPAPTRSSRS